MKTDVETKPLRCRMQFENESQALAYRQRTRTGGWVLGRFLYLGDWPNNWTPTEVMLDCPDEGVLK